MDSMKKLSYIQYVKGHKNSKGESAPWVIKDHSSGKILSSHKTKAEAQKHLRQMKFFKHKKSSKMLLRRGISILFDHIPDLCDE